MKGATHMSLFLIFSISNLLGQVDCTKFSESPRGEEGLDAYSVYMQAIKMEDWKLAYDQWKIAYEIAPAADGKRDHNFTKGVEILTAMYEKEEDAARKKEMVKTIDRLYSECYECYRQGAINPPDCESGDCVEEQIGHLKNEYAYMMYYHLRQPYRKNLKLIRESLSLTGKHALYTIFVPAANIVIHQYDKGAVDDEVAREVYLDLQDVYEYNRTDEKYGQYYQQGWDYAQNVYAPFENEIFDCEFFLNKFKPQYEATPDDPELLKKIIAKLKAVDCPGTDPFFMEVDEKWKKYAEEENARLRAEFEAKNPGVAAKRLYDEGKYKEAIEKYELAISTEEDVEKKAGYLFSKASILFRKLNRYSEARSTAYEAAELRPEWGRPYMLIGDMYGSTASSCGDDWNQRMAILAAIDKYKYARAIDEEVADEATKKISRYYGSKPEKSEGHMRGVKPGDRQTVGCWIGETVSVSFK
ncbi:MAG: hypothetical protein R3275_04560 [Saprospiraceae bacterium]|nr:hypothetical protein [Saprospiraceae bacterium]